jgi:hypothetical protein
MALTLLAKYANGSLIAQEKASESIRNPYTYDIECSSG